ncbi:MAG: hypothetical protein ACLU6W_13275 [Lachnospiraceae bacterium]
MKKQLCFRKWWIYLGVFIGLSGLAACGKEEPPPVAEEVYEESNYTLRVKNVQDFEMEKEYEYQEGTDWDWSYLNIHTLSAFAKGEKGYYVRLDEFIYFCDFEKGTLTPLCSRPDCLHDKETNTAKQKECTAYLTWGGKGEGIQYYDGKLYANLYANEFTNEGGIRFSGDRLVAISEDGSSREVLDYELEDCYNFMLHRGSIYYTSYMTDPETLVNTQTVYRIDMESGEKSEIVRLDGWPVLRVYPLGGYVYILVPNGEGPTVRKVIYEIQTGRAKVEEGNLQETLLPDKKGKLLLGTVVDTNQLTVEEITMDGSQRELVGDLSITNLNDFTIGQGSDPVLTYWFTADESYFYVFGYIDHHSENSAIQDYPLEAVFDRNTGELLRVFELESRPPAQNFGVDDTYLFYMCDMPYSGETKVYWMKKEDLLKPEAKLQMMEP